MHLEYENKIRKEFRPVNKIYTAVEKHNDIIYCYFSYKINISLSGTYSEKRIMQHRSTWQCYHCSNYFERKDKFDRHIKTCSGQPGVIYDFNVQNIVIFEDNIKYKGNIPLSIYIDFEANAPTESSLDSDYRKTFAVSYVIIFAFHLYLKLDRLIIERSFGHSLEN